VTRRAGFSAQTLEVLAVLCDEPRHWWHGYALAKRTGLKSGTLYPILVRLAERGLLDAVWEVEPEPGRPRRHLYRLTDLGLAESAAAVGVGTEPRGGAARNRVRSRS
jgi:PadR family transcriptional regulator, regulatory protein PadR